VHLRSKSDSLKNYNPMSVQKLR